MRFTIFALVLACGHAAGADPRDTWTGKPVWVAGTTARVYDISPDGKRFLMSDWRSFGVFDRDSGKLLWTVPDGSFHDGKFSPDGKTVACGEWQKGLNFYDTATGKRLHTVPAGDERPWQVFYRPDGTLLYHTSVSSFAPAPPWTLKYSIVHYDPTARKERGKVSGTVTYTETNPWLWHRGAGFVLEHHQIFGTNTTTRRIANYTDPLTGKKTPTIDLHVNDVPLDLSPDAKLLLVMVLDEEPRLVDTATGKTKVALGPHKRFVTDGAFSPDGKLVATVTGTVSMHATRGALNTGKAPLGPAEYVVWDVATGKEVARAAFPTNEFDFDQVRFSPDSKYLLLSSKEGAGDKSRGHYAVGVVPFERVGGAALAFPRDEPPKPKAGPAPGAPGALVSDPLDRLVEELAKSGKPAADKLDALFLAALGRFATAREQKWVKDVHTDRLTADVLRKLLAEIAKSPEFEAHVKSLQQRAPGKPLVPSWPGGFPGQPIGPRSFGSAERWPEEYPNGWSGRWTWPLAPPASFPPAVQHPGSGDRFSRLADALEGLGVAPADRFDALHFALHGRLASAREHWVARHRFGYQLTAAADIELRWAAGDVSPFDPRRPWLTLQGGAEDWYRLHHAFGAGRGLVSPSPMPPFGAPPGCLVPNPLALPFVPWFPAGSAVPVPRANR